MKIFPGVLTSKTAASMVPKVGKITEGIIRMSLCFHMMYLVAMTMRCWSWLDYSYQNTGRSISLCTMAVRFGPFSLLSWSFL